MAVDMVRVEDGAALGRSEVILFFEGFLVVHFCFRVTFELREAVGEVVFIYLLYWVQQTDRRLHQDFCGLMGLIL
jgi:hypothetical protein